MVPLLHPAGRAGSLEAGDAAAALADALGREVLPRPYGPGEREAAVLGAVPSGAFALLPGEDLVRGPALPAGRLVVLPRRDPRWSLEDPLLRTLDRLPTGTRVSVPSDLGEALLQRARPDLEAVRTGALPEPGGMPRLAEASPGRGPAGALLDPAAFVPAPGTGIAALLSADGERIPAGVRALEDEASREALSIEAALVSGVGSLPPGAALGAMAKRKVSVLFVLRAVLFRPGAPPRDLLADIPLADARAFGRGFGRHLSSG